MPSPSDCATLTAIFEGVDAARAAAEAEWGTERLPLLVDEDLRIKLRKQQTRWSVAYQEAWETDALTGPQLEAVRSTAGGMVRAWAALSAVASEAGHRPISPEVWEGRLADGTVLAVVRTNDEAVQVIASGRAVAVYTLAEVANVIDALPAALQMAKVHFPGAKVLGAGDRSWVKQGDPLPDFTQPSARAVA